MKIFKVGEVAKIVGLSVNTLQRLDREGKIKSKRTVTNRRYYTEEDIQLILGNKVEEVDTRKVVGYCRVSSPQQKQDLKNQEEYLRSYILGKGIILDQVYKDIGSGLNYKRKDWNKLLDKVSKGEISKIYVTYKDRFIRFGYEWFEDYCRKFNTEIVILNLANTSPEEELTEDLLSILHVFSARSYGIRKYKTKVKGMLLDGNHQESKDKDISGQT